MRLDDDRAFEHLGKLHDYRMPSRTSAGGVFCAFVFLQRPLGPDAAPQSPRPAAEEVSSVLWVPLEHFHRSKAWQSSRATHIWHLGPRQRTGTMAMLLPRPLQEALGLTRARMPAVHVLSKASEVIYSESTDPSADPPPALLWGMTLRSTSDLIELLDGARVDVPAYVPDNPVLAAGAHILHFVLARFRDVARLAFWPRRRQRRLLLPEPKPS